MKRLYRSEKNKIFGGLIGGLGEYYDVDPALLRLVFIAILIFTAIIPGLIFYFIGLMVVPKRSRRKAVEKDQ